MKRIELLRNMRDPANTFPVALLKARGCFTGSFVFAVEFGQRLEWFKTQADAHCWLGSSRYSKDPLTGDVRKEQVFQ